MAIVTLGLSAATLVGMAVILTYILGWANKKFHVEVDPRIEAVMSALPGANCGGCGYVGCGEYAEAVVLNNAPVDKCPVGGESCAAEIASIMGVELDTSFPYRPIVHCGAYYEDRLQRHDYRGERTCRAANLVAGVQGCTYGCMGFGDCTRACNYDAIHVVNGLATVNYDKCIGCGACIKACPRNIISMAPFKAKQMLAVTCANQDTGKDVTSVCKVGCIGCKACARASDIFKVENNVSTIDYEAYPEECTVDMMKACEKCPRNRLVFVGEPSQQHIDAVKDEELPDVVKPDFKTTVDDVRWRG